MHMYTTYFDEYQKQFTAWQQQVGDWQKKFFDAWLENLPAGKADVNFSESFDQALKFQEDLVNTYLETQEKSSRMMLESQRKFWEDYFARMRQQSASTQN